MRHYQSIDATLYTVYLFSIDEEKRGGIQSTY